MWYNNYIKGKAIAKIKDCYMKGFIMNIEKLTIEELAEMAEKTNDVDVLLEIAYEIEDKTFIEEANGSLSTLYNLREERKQSLIDDEFFDDEEIAKKYDWNDEDYERACEKTNEEIRNLLNEEERKKYTSYLKDCISDMIMNYRENYDN